MKVIVLASRKGGVSKSTLTAHLAVEAGKGVAIIDTDSQGSLSDWWNERESTDPAFVSTSIPELRNTLKDLDRQGFRYVFIDTPPAIDKGLIDLAKLADLVVIPVRPSPHDLRAVGATVELVEPTGTPFFFVVSSATKRARLTGEAAINLSQHGKVAPSIIGHRTDFAASMIDGRTAGELNPKGRSAEEITALWQYTNRQLRLKR